MEVPAELLASHALYFGDAGRRWVARLPELADRCLTRWELRVDGVPRYGAVAWVIPVVGADGVRAVLKLQPVDDETIGEAAALECWGGAGSVRLLAHDPETGSLLLERLDASRSLATVPDLAAVGIIAGLLAQLNAATPPPDLRRLEDVAHATLRPLSAALTAVRDNVERRLLETCAGRTRELLGEPVQHRLLHWDLHYDNVLYAPDRQPGDWVAIDPKPLLGDSGFEFSRPWVTAGTTRWRPGHLQSPRCAGST